MNEARPYASLSSGLLARKGTAKPAMRPQGFGQYGSHEDLGWNDMGHGPNEADATPSAPEHVPSSIAALTPAPKGPRHEGDGEDELVRSYEEGEAAEESLEEIETGADTAAETASTQEFELPTHFEADTEFEVSAETPPTFDAASVVAQQRALLERLDGLEEPEAAAPEYHETQAEIVKMPRRIGDRRKAAFTLRLDAERHLRLRLACAVTGQSAQHIVVGALDEALERIPELEALASQVPAKPGRTGKL